MHGKISNLFFHLKNTLASVFNSFIIFILKQNFIDFILGSRRKLEYIIVYKDSKISYAVTPNIWRILQIDKTFLIIWCIFFFFRLLVYYCFSNFSHTYNRMWYFKLLYYRMLLRDLFNKRSDIFSTSEYKSKLRFFFMYNIGKISNNLNFDFYWKFIRFFFYFW